MVAIIVQVILSWISPGTYTPASALLNSLTAPILRPIQQLLPPISGIDLSPLFALIGLQVLKMLILPLLN
jgi:YggT family protein